MVNNEPISLEAFVNASQLFLTRWDTFIQNDPKKKHDLKEIMLANMIDEMLLDQEARRKGLELTEEAVDEEIARLTKPYTEEDLEQSASLGHRTLAAWRAGFKRRIVHKRLIEQEVVREHPGHPARDARLLRAQQDPVPRARAGAGAPPGRGQPLGLQ